MRATRCSTALAALVIVGCTSMIWAQLPPAQTVILSSHSSGVGGASFAPDSFTGKMDERGVTTFSAQLLGAASDEDFGLWRANGGGSAVLLMLEGDPAPGIPDVYLTGPSIFQPMPIPLLLTSLTGSVDTTNDVALWRGLQLVARKGDRAPGTPEGVYWSYGTVPLRAQANGTLAFGQYLTGTGVDASNNEGIWTGSGGVSLAIRKGATLPGGGVATNLFSSNIANPGLNLLGTLAFRAQYDGTASGIWAGAGSALERVAGTGDILPGHPSVVLGSVQDDPALSQQGSLAFKGFVATSLDEGLWAGTPETLRLVALENDAPPGAGGATFKSFDNPTIAGELVAFRCFFWTAGEAVYREQEGEGLELVAMTGQHPPGAPTGAEFLSFGAPSVNSLGQVVFQARMTGPTITTANQDGVWMLQRDGQLVAVALQGESLEIGPGDTRLVSSIGFAGGYLSNIGQGNGLSFNERGQILLYASFSDGVNGLLISTPEVLLIFENGFEEGDPTGWAAVY